MAIRFVTASTLVAAACALSFASPSHAEVASAPLPKSPSPPCNLPTTNPLIVWHRAPGAEDRAEKVAESDLYHCRPMLDVLRGPALGPSAPGYCSKVAWLSDNPGYNTLISPAAPLKNVIEEVGDC